MKKGMCVTLDNGMEFNLVDSVTYNDEKFFAATTDQSEELIFFKQTGEDELEAIDADQYKEVVEALINHISQTFKE